MVLTTTDTIDGKKLEPLGIVTGATVQTVHLGKDIAASFRTLVGGEAQGYNEMMKKARDLATERMVSQANDLQADAIVCMRYTTSSIMQGAAEVMAYGTAVKFV